MSSYLINASSRMSGAITVPPSKSHTLRAILLASMACGRSRINHPLHSPDVKAMIKACSQLGAHITWEHDTLHILGVDAHPQVPDDVIDVGNSGQVLRFISAMAALLSHDVVLTGDHSICYNRPMQPLINGLSHLGVSCISTKGDGYAPLIIKGPMLPGKTLLDGQDSQPVSALLMAAAFLPGTTQIEVRNPGEKPWIALTWEWLKRLGVKGTHQNFMHYTVQGGEIRGFDYTVPGDFSSMAYPVVASLITHSNIRVDGLNPHDTQGDKQLLDILNIMGADLSWHAGCLQVASTARLQGCDIDINNCIDALPILAVVGCYASGITRLLGAGSARHKESDRLSAITSELRKMGADIREYKDSLEIKQTLLHGAEVHSHHDHRIAMSLAVAACALKQGHSMVHYVTCVAKSYPNFIETMQNLGCSIEAIATKQIHS